MKKGPQTIEKAKQGAYVARSVSSLQRIRMNNGETFGIKFDENQIIETLPYYDFLRKIIKSDKKEDLADFILTVGIVSNHGNWFTENDHNKELKVLAKSYDWLFFLTDQGITEFVKEVILTKKNKYKPVRDAFLSSYKKDKKQNIFTKVLIDSSADDLLTKFFITNNERIENWFNIITPRGRTLKDLEKELNILKNKEWEKLLYDSR